MSVRFSANALSRYGSEVQNRCRAYAARFRAADDCTSQRMLAGAIQPRCPAKNLLLGEAARGDDAIERRPPHRNGPGLVEHQRVHVTKILDRLRVSKQNAQLRA